ncbi:undecaprenyl-phosphate glucose phosphotransferase [Pedobacter sp. V48]|uniref:undecaprenyl-phosphate glucose phosphotransferase n=1 Tax=Pedobacter sp. V48 TaxID=509635 RepID=UPI0006645161|nr:undecaprenyl-phosphate glucose phosphotransferase [Pedobacter sp. V48]
MLTRYIYLLRYVLLVTDVIMLNIIYFSAYYLSLSFGKSIPDELHQHYLVVCNLIWLFNTAVFGLYTLYGARKLTRIYRGTWRSVALHIVLFTGYLMLSKDHDFSKTFLLTFYVMLCFSFLLNRFLGTAIQYYFLSKFNGAKKVAVMGSNRTAVRISNYFQKQRNVQFCGFVGGDEHMFSVSGNELSEATCTKLAEAAGNGVVDLYVAVAPERMTDVKPLMLEAEKHCIRLKFIPDFGGSLGTPYTVSYLGGEFPIITLRKEPLEEMSSRFKKRVFDVVFSSLVIIFILSWLYPLIAILIKMQSKGPVMFKQLRSGRNDEPFWCYKFRSMKVNDASDKKQATKDDDRITPIGKFLRRSSLDEMPQFFNVFMGSMSVVGPRPHMLKHTEEYKAIINQYMVRQFLKPGITGWAQVNGFRGETKATEDMENRVKCDIHYLENWDSMFDVKIIFMTVLNVMHGEDNAF